MRLAAKTQNMVRCRMASAVLEYHRRVEEYPAWGDAPTRFESWRTRKGDKPESINPRKGIIDFNRKTHQEMGAYFLRRARSRR